MGYLCYGRSCHDLQVYGERQGPWCYGSTGVISPLSLANRSRHRQSLRIHHQSHQPHQAHQNHLQRWWWRGMERRPSTREAFAISRDCVCFMLIEQVSCFVESLNLARHRFRHHGRSKIEVAAATPCRGLWTTVASGGRTVLNVLV